ncbi:hypothetical protein ABOM_007454 [Aspergillus bombycis]|uniref:Uncharacterized protein n=1 Tax=Aspergillus bombycis TaxID=109264 RepID=A0A1F7ZZ02_9EURO|nr:hypothetical protein ABOM_007454 [Aspergillus bombycis]OGM44674.1 hypothetical protein ABOM_007454 [Aspergillus bombycis]
MESQTIVLRYVVQDRLEALLKRRYPQGGYQVSPCSLLAECKKGAEKHISISVIRRGICYLTLPQALSQVCHCAVPATYARGLKRAPN